MINGDGFFVLSKGGTQYFSRAGAFTLDSAGHMVAPDGAEACDASGTPIDLSALNTGAYKSYWIGSDGVITGVKADGTTSTLGQLAIATFPQPERADEGRQQRVHDVGLVGRAEHRHAGHRVEGLAAKSFEILA